MEWLVYANCFNRNSIERVNILEYRKEALKKLKRKYKEKENFAEQLRRDMTYCYWAKFEWELMIRKESEHYYLTPFPWQEEDIMLDVTDDAAFDWAGFYDWAVEKRYVGEDGIKFDVYMQLDYRWEEYVNYFWENTHPYSKK